MFLERSIIFQPKKLPRDFQFQSNYPLTEYFFEFDIERSHFLINVVHIKSPGSKGTVFYLHGTLAHIQHHILKVEEFILNGYDVIMMDYPGYGKSKGKFSEQALHELVELTYRETIAKLYVGGNIVIAGRSLGTALASNLAGKVDPYKLILISPYYNMPDLFRHHAMNLPFNLKFRFENDIYLPKVNCETYVLHGDRDKLIPADLSRRLIPFIKDQSHYIEIPGADHFNIHRLPLYSQCLKAILA